jgi:outer membrane protein, heavy metal efflux system
VILIFLLAAAAASAQPVTISLDEAVERALSTHPNMSVMRSALAVSAAEMGEARSLPSPEFRLSTRNFDFDPLTVEERSAAAIRYSPPRPRQLRLRQRIVSARQHAAEAEVRLTAGRLAAEVRYAYRRAALAAQRSELQDQVLRLRQRIKTTIDRQVAAGLKEADEADLAELAVGEAHSDLQRARALAAAEKRRLTRLIDPEGALEFALAVDPSLFMVASEPPRIAGLVAHALQSRGELDVQSGACLEHAAEMRAARNEIYPWFSFAQLTYRTNTLPGRSPWGYQIGVDLPLFRPAASARARLAHARLARCEMQKTALATQIRHEVEESADALEALRAELHELDRLRSGPAERAAERARAALSLGRAEQVDVLNAEARILSLRDRWLERRIRFAEMEARLELAVGAPPQDQ